MHQRETCIDCGKTSPPTNTDSTLVSSFGWRMSRRIGATGEYIAEWRCPACWQQYKVRKGVVTADGSVSTAPKKRE